MLFDLVQYIHIFFLAKKIKRLIRYIPNNPKSKICDHTRNEIITIGIENNKSIFSINDALNNDGYNVLSFNEIFSICKNNLYDKNSFYKYFFDDYEKYKESSIFYNNIEELQKNNYKDYIDAYGICIVYLLFAIWIKQPTYLFYLLFIFTIIILFTDIFHHHKLKKSIEECIKNNETELCYVRYYILKNKMQKELDNYYKKEEDRKRLEEEKRLKQQRSYWQKYWSEKQQNGFDFENAVGELYRKLGYKVKITQGTGDGGVDLILQKDGQTIIVQCKAHTHQVGPEPVRALWGVREDFNANGAIFIAYSGVTQGAKDFAKGKNLKIIDIEDIINLSIQANSQEIYNDSIF